MNPRDVAVVGAGLGGLAAAARLAANGHRVVVHERAPAVGGKLGTATVDGTVFDTGPSLLTAPHLLDELWAAVGAPAGVPVPERVDPACGYRFADGTSLTLPADPERVPAALDAALGPGVGRQWTALTERGARLWELTEHDVLRRPLRFRDLVRLGMRPADLRVVAPWRTLDGLARRAVPDPRLRAWLWRYATYSGSDPRRTPAVAGLTTAYLEQHFGSWYVPGGLRRIVEAVRARCDELGVAVRTGSEVTAVRTDGRRATGLRLADGTETDADVVVCNADADVLYDRLLPRGRGRRAGPARRTRSMFGFALLLTLDDPPPGPAHRVWFPHDYAAEFDAIFGRPPRPVDDPTVYVHAPDDPALGHGWFVLVNAPEHDPARGVDWDAPGLADRYADHVLDVLADRGTDVRGRVRARTVRTPADLERETAAPGGAIYGTAAHGATGGVLRPGNRSRVRGLYLVGGSSHPGGGIPLVLLSAEIVAGIVERDHPPSYR